MSILYGPGGSILHKNDKILHANDLNRCECCDPEEEEEIETVSITCANVEPPGPGATDICLNNIISTKLRVVIGGGFVDNGVCGDFPNYCADLSGTYILDLQSYVPDPIGPTVILNPAIDCDCITPGPLGVSCATWEFKDVATCDTRTRNRCFRALLNTIQGAPPYELCLSIEDSTPGCFGPRLGGFLWGKDITNELSCLWNGESLTLDGGGGSCFVGTSAGAAAPCTTAAPATISLTAI